MKTDNEKAEDTIANPSIGFSFIDPRLDPPAIVKDPNQWVSGNDQMTPAQASYLRTLCELIPNSFDAKLTKAEASERIDALKQLLGIEDEYCL